MIGLVGLIPTTTAANETSAGYITGTEVWSGGHTLTGDIVIQPGAKLIVQPGTTVNIPNGTFIDVRGALCAGDVACGANGMASNSSRITFNWQDPADPSAMGRCYGLFNNQHWNVDPSCGEGILIRNTVDVGYTKLNHVSLVNAYGIPSWVTDISEVRYGALVLDGASPTLSGLKFEGVNTTSLLLLDLASPDIVGGEFVTGDDASSLVGSAIQAYGAGSALNPLNLYSPVFTGTGNGCNDGDDGRHVLWAEKSFVYVDHAVIASGDYGMRFDDSSGIVKSATIDTDCNGIDVNNKRTVGGVDYKLVVEDNDISTGEKAPLTAFNRAWVDFIDNRIDGASGSSGVQISDSVVTISGGSIGPIGGWNGIWSIGESDVIVEGVTISGTAKEPLIAGEYHYGDSGWGVPYPTKNRMHVHGSNISSDGGQCESVKAWGGEFPCPAVHAFRSSLTLIDNDISIGGGGDGIRAIGAILDVRDNDITTNGTGALIKNHDTNYANQPEYGSLAFFSMNRWQNVGQTYNVTKSSVTVQSEQIQIPNPAAVAEMNSTDPVSLNWPDAEANDANGWVGKIWIPPCSEWPPQDFPLTMALNNNSTVFSFANLTGLSTSNIFIETSPNPRSVQIRKAEIVKFRALVSGVRVGGANILVEDARGDDLYSLVTDEQGWTQEISLASDFHLDINGTGPDYDNDGVGDWPDDHADDAGENSCNDGIDNDGDLLYDSADPDCHGSSREKSLYYITAYKFGKGYKRYSIEMDSQTGVLSEVIPLENLAPSLTVTQSDGHSFKKVVNFTGTAHDGEWDGIYGDDSMSLIQRNTLAQWDQKGVVEEVQVKDPFTNDWIDMRVATDISGSGGEVTYNNHPFRYWNFEFNMADRPEGDYTFEFRSYDGVDYSPIITRTIKLNTDPPTVIVNSPTNNSQISEGIVQFSGTASDSYNGIFGSDIQKIWFEVEGPPTLSQPDGYRNLFNKPGGTSWSAEWSVAHLPTGNYDIKIWANDSAFCSFEIGECYPDNYVHRSLYIDNSNSIPVVNLLSPYEGQIVTVSDNTIINGVARDTDGVVSYVEITILDMQSQLAGGGYAPLSEGTHSLVQNIDTSTGAWSVAWDTNWYATNEELIHNYHYIVQARAFDGFEFSDIAEVEIIIDNPPNANNQRPVFDSQSWPSSFTVYCDQESSGSAVDFDRCDTLEVDLSDYFSDPDGDVLKYYVKDDPDISADDDHRGAAKVNKDTGVMTFNPMTIVAGSGSGNTVSLENLSLYSVVFYAIDQTGQGDRESLPINLEVVGISFSAECTGIYLDETNESTYSAGCPDSISKSETLLYTGRGLPGATVVAKTSSNTLGSDKVDDNGNWLIPISGTRLKSGDNQIFFEYRGAEQPASNQNSDTNIQVGSGGDEDSGWLGTILIIIGVIVGLAILGGTFVFFFVEFEDYDEDDLDVTEAEVDPYAWAKQGQAAAAVGAAAGVAATQVVAQQPVQQQPVVEQATQPAVQGYPGWKWDAEQNKWVPDNQ